MPKAANITHNRFFLASYAFAVLFGMSNRDRIYLAMPLYHSAAGIVGVGMLFHANSFLVIRSKFSASNFITDVRKHRCTVMQYIGEICRYILATPPKDDDRDNDLRLAMGNGLRPDIWRQFQERFAIGKIGEFYAATDGAAALINTEGKFGAIGFISPLVNAVIPAAIFKIDPDTQELLRDKRGRCIECAPGEAGEFLAKIFAVRHIENFTGYTNPEDSQKKLALDVKKEGDRWFRSGDLLRRDAQGFIYFVDRLGDTFRWKGENCSTAEISEAAFTALGKGEINVYGVQVQGKDGRAGMAAVAGVRPEEVNLQELAASLKSALPSYAVPLFLRFMGEKMEVTGTYKHKKVELRNQGFDVAQVKDPVFFLEGDTYIPLTAELYDKIISGQIRL